MTGQGRFDGDRFNDLDEDEVARRMELHLQFEKYSDKQWHGMLSAWEHGLVHISDAGTLEIDDAEKMAMALSVVELTEDGLTES